MKLLHIDSSILGENSVSRQLSAASVANWRQRDPRIEVEYRDLAAEPLPHLSGASLAKADPAEAEAAERTMQQFLDADVIVIGAPMYNFGIPSTLKAWIDRVAVAGRTFRYTEKGPEGLAGGKKLVVAGAFGGIHAGSPTDFVEPYLRQVFGFLGITDIEFVRADGIAYGPEHRERAINAALARIAANDEELAKAA
ncbi:MAG TPA: NAD(P)H-dependent oxidoreductase [Pseudoxanthomonas sp.]|nr:NAD(P)H-dependent oxidoreductase [Pseudoxanthomonas sp.]